MGLNNYVLRIIKLILKVLVLKPSECVRKYLQDDGSEHPEFTTTVMDEFPDEPAYRKCRDTLNSSAKLESLVFNCI